MISQALLGLRANGGPTSLRLGYYKMTLLDPHPARNRGSLERGLAEVRAYAAGTPPSTLSRLPVLLPERVSEAKCMTAWAMSSGKMFTPRVVRLR